MHIPFCIDYPKNNDLMRFFVRDIKGGIILYKEASCKIKHRVSPSIYEWSVFRKQSDPVHSL